MFLCERASDSCTSRKSKYRKRLCDPTAGLQPPECWSRPTFTAWSLLYTDTGLPLCREVTVIHINTHIYIYRYVHSVKGSWMVLSFKFNGNSLVCVCVCVCVCVYMCRYKQSHLVTARASVTVMHPELGCLISCVQLQEFSIILLYAEEGQSPGITFLEYK